MYERMRSMKKFKLFLILAGMILLLVGCDEPVVPTSTDSSAETEAVSVEESSQKNDEVAKGENRLIAASEIDKEILSWHRVSDTVCDLDGDGEKDDEVVLATTAECNAKHEFIWNDGQNWALYVVSDSKTYLLFNEYINAGYPYFEIAEYYMENGVKTQIDVVTSAGASFSLRGYSYSEKEDGFIEENLYSTKDVTAGGINRIFSSFPEYRSEVKPLY